MLPHASTTVRIPSAACNFRNFAHTCPSLEDHCAMDSTSRTRNVDKKRKGRKKGASQNQRYLWLWLGRQPIKPSHDDHDSTDPRTRKKGICISSWYQELSKCLSWDQSWWSWLNCPCTFYVLCSAHWIRNECEDQHLKTKSRQSGKLIFLVWCS